MKWSFSMSVLVVLLLACTACDAPQEDKLPPFERSQFLENYAQNLIQPAAQKLKDEVGLLQKSIKDLAVYAEVNQIEQALIETPEVQAARKAWKASYRAWIKVSMLNFGPGGSEGRRRNLVEEVGTWPVNVAALEAKIREENFDFNDSKRNTRGFLALEYLLFQADPADGLSLALSPARTRYLETTVNKLEAQVTAFNEAWQGEYAQTFVANTGTDVKSSTTQMFNELVRNFEALRDQKLAAPAGLIAGQTGPQPELAEAQFSGESLDYLILNYRTVENHWRGIQDSGEDGTGWDDYLKSIEGGAALVDSMEASFKTVDDILGKIPAEKRLKELAVENNSSLNALNKEFKRLTRYFKSDASSLLGLAITFSTGDGD